MVKFRGKPAKKEVPHVAGETGVVHVYAPEHLSRRRRLRDFRPSRQTLILLLVAIVVVGGGSWWLLAHNQDNSVYRARLPDTKTFYSDRISALESQAPPKSATGSEKAKYYDQLAGAFLELGDYQHAVEYMEKIEDTLPTYFDYHDYILLASYYHELSDKTNAGIALDKATQLLPQTDIPSELPRKDLLKRIDDFRKEYAT